MFIPKGSKFVATRGDSNPIIGVFVADVDIDPCKERKAYLEWAERNGRLNSGFGMIEWLTRVARKATNIPVFEWRVGERGCLVNRLSEVDF